MREQNLFIRSSISLDSFNRMSSRAEAFRHRLVVFARSVADFRKRVRQTRPSFDE